MQNRQTSTSSLTLLQWRRWAALATALALVLTSLPLPSVWAAPVTPATRVQPTAAQRDLSSLTVPESLGFVIETWQPDDRPSRGFVIHLQDLRAAYDRNDGVTLHAYLTELMQ